jgi:hypothetical protein
VRGHFPSDVTRLTIHSACPSARAYPLVPLNQSTWLAEAPSMIIPPVTGVNPLQTTLLELGIVSGRVALLLRSAEIQPGFDRFVIDGLVSQD